MSGRLSRRQLLGWGAGAVGAVAAGGWLAGGRLLSSGEPGKLLRSQAPLPRIFEASLPIPTVLAPARTDGTTDFYEITQKRASLGILPGLQTNAWTYNGSFPGPTIVSRAGRRTVVRHRNELPQPVVVHLHGGHTPPDSDGHSLDLITPVGGGWSGEDGTGHHAVVQPNIVEGERDYVYPMNQRAATLWYHDHRHGYTGPALWQGLSGFHLVEDDDEQELALPRGERDIPLMITDRSFAADGSFQYPHVDPNLRVPGVTDAYMNGVLGDVILVNGAPWPVLAVGRARYRLRLLNGSNARRYRLELDPPPPGGGGLVQIGSDGGLLDRPVAHDRVEMSSAERFDVIIDFARYAPGTQVRLVNRLGTDGTAQVMRFDVSAQANPASDDSMIPERLSTVERLDPGQATVTRTFLFQSRFDRWTINDQPYQPGRAVARPKLGTTEIWRFITDFHHPVHLHLSPFQVISRNNSEPSRYDGGWKDTVDVRAAEAVEVAVRFTDYAGMFMLHCHNLEHEDMAMMADFIAE